MLNTIKPLISIVIPYFNADKFIMECLDSIFSQEYSLIEIIIIDDGSDIPVNKILKSSYLKKIILSRNKKNEGVSYSLNKGIELSRGNFICRLDADDVMLPNRIKSQIDFLVKNPEYACVCGQIKTIKGIGYYRYPTHFNSICIGALFGNPIAHPTVMFRSEIIKKYRYIDFKNIRGFEDYFLWLTLINDGHKFFCLNNELILYRIHSLQLSQLKNNYRDELIFSLPLNFHNLPFQMYQDMKKKNSFLRIFFAMIYTLNPRDLRSVLEIYKTYAKKIIRFNKLNLFQFLHIGLVILLIEFSFLFLKE